MKSSNRSHILLKEKKKQKKRKKENINFKSVELDIRESDYTHSNVSAIGNAHAVVC